MSMSNKKILSLINKLISKTEEKTLDWEITASTSKYISALSDYTVSISEEGEDYYFTIYDVYDDLVERISDVELKSEVSNSYDIMHSFFNLARRNARGADKAVDDLLDFLE